jgi:UDP-2-acetamido-3-amino-2,3-dideoxy-glucuronate N-acetyltransferase
MAEYSIQIHEPHQVHHTVLIGDGSVIYPFATILAGVVIGKDCIIGSCCLIGAQAVIGDGCRLHHGCAIPAQACIGARVFIGSNVTLTDVRHPQLQDKGQEVHRPPIIEDDVVLGANCVIRDGVVIGQGAIVGMGAVVMRDVAPGRTVVGNPARLLPRPLVGTQGATRGGSAPSITAPGAPRPGISAEDRAHLMALAHQLRAVAEPQGALHSWWDWIGDIEAVVVGAPTVLHLTPAEYIAAAHVLLVMGERPQAPEPTSSG